MKNKAIVGGIGLVVIIVAGQFYTKAAYEESIDAQVKQLKEQLRGKSVSLAHQPAERDIFSASDVFEINISADDTRLQLLNLNGDLTFNALNNCTLLPFYITCDTALEPLSSAAINMAKTYPVEYKAGWSANVLFNSVESFLTTEETVIDDFDGKLVLAPTSIYSETNLEMSEYEIEANWKGMTLTGSSTGTDISLGRFQYTAEAELEDKNFFTGESTIDLTDIKIVSNASAMLPSEILIDKIMVSTEMEREEDALYELEYEFHIDNISTGTTKDVISNVEADISIDQLSPELLSALRTMDSQSQGKAFDSAINIFGQREHNITIEKFGFHFNDEPISITGDLKLARHKAADYDKGEIGQKINGVAEISIAKELAESSPLISLVLAEQIKQEVLTLEDNTYKGDFVIKQGEVMTNDKRLFKL
ncbi:DUF945 family protein [Alteromonas lipotrueiana]|uniref:DUF945 family protein n=1 Tax=Alteromonas lipotrueiana TaxID=2803815 RepID=UPI001C4482D4|nr:DUF945 family protein [Alteromonas lipotrueiana]